MPTHSGSFLAALSRLDPAKTILAILALLASVLPILAAPAAAPADEFFPNVPPDFEISLFAQEPLVRNPCALAFDAKGRLCVSSGPQYRNPRPDTPGDSVFILLDHDHDGRADSRKEFATGFNSIQSLAWKGRDLWVANSPDLTIVRDLDGDDEADEYIRVYTDLGNLEHALHGLNWAPDGKLYMSKGNSKGLTQPPHRVAPKPFRDLWGVDIPGLPDMTPTAVFKKGQYQRTYHDPSDDWGREGGVLRCDDLGAGLEIVSRGFRNPWDITFNDEFNWLGTDNDQTLGDKIFSPFYGAHFGWGHPWSFDWKGDDHLPTVPASGPLFEGSGTGVIYCGLARYPAPYRDVFLINDWLRREVLLFHPTWSGAQLVAREDPLPVLASAGSGRSMERSSGRKFDPVDIEIGPDEAIYISSWGREYGFNGRQFDNEGRIYRLWPKAAPPISWTPRDQPAPQRSIDDLISDLGSHLPIWRVNAQDELVRRANPQPLLQLLQQQNLPARLQTWALWTLGRMPSPDPALDAHLLRFATSSPLNRRVQAIRALAHRGLALQSSWLLDPEPRIRFETLLALRQSSATSRDFVPEILNLAAREKDRLTYYAAWHAMRALLPTAERQSLIRDPRPGARRAIVLGLLEDDALSSPELTALTSDPDPAIAALVKRRLAGKAEVAIRGRPLPATPLPRNPPADAPRSADLGTVLAALSKADPKRGRNLFFDPKSAACSSCHQLEGNGNVFAPDLSQIGSRADAEFIARSILDPSAQITEGFVQHVFTLRDGDEYSGILLEETGAGVTLALANGQKISLPTAQIQRRQTSKQSAMPANFAHLLDAQEVADLVAYLQSATRSLAPIGPAFRFHRDNSKLEIFHGTHSVASYLFEHPELTRPAFVNVRTLNNLPVTREFPAPPDADHRLLHPGIAISFGDLDGHDYWRLNAKVRHASFTEEPLLRSGQLTFAVRNEYLATTSPQIVCLEDARYILSASPDALILEIDTQFHNDTRDFYFGDQEESGLCVRVPADSTVKSGRGLITNDRGERNEKGTWGKEFLWIDYSNTDHAKPAGITIVPHPDNARPCWAHSRDYGVLVANPFPRQPQSRREPFVKTWVKKGDRFHLRYTLRIHHRP